MIYRTDARSPVVVVVDFVAVDSVAGSVLVVVVVGNISRKMPVLSQYSGMLAGSTTPEPKEYRKI